jgi:predicted acyl esterase
LRMHVNTLGGPGQLDARLWDVAPNGQEAFVSRGTYALTAGQQGTISWQLFGGGYTFLAGHTIRLELLNSDVPFLRPSDDPSAVTVSNVLVELPSHEPPDGNEIVSPMFEPTSLSRTSDAQLRVRLLGHRGHRIRR